MNTVGSWNPDYSGGSNTEHSFGLGLNHYLNIFSFYVKETALSSSTPKQTRRQATNPSSECDSPEKREERAETKIRILLFTVEIYFTTFM